MPGLAPQLPLMIDPTDRGYRLIKTIRRLVKQNLKMLILTHKGERMMDVNFGVGLREYLFEHNLPEVHSQIEEEIRTQVKKYIPHVAIKNVIVTTSDQKSDMGMNAIGIVVMYSIIPLGTSSTLKLDISSDH